MNLAVNVDAHFAVSVAINIAANGRHEPRCLRTPNSAVLSAAAWDRAGP